jgi:hypothetical protein
VHQIKYDLQSHISLHGGPSSPQTTPTHSHSARPFIVQREGLKREGLKREGLKREGLRTACTVASSSYWPTHRDPRDETHHEAHPRIVCQQRVCEKRSAMQRFHAIKTLSSKMLSEDEIDQIVPYSVIEPELPTSSARVSIPQA